MERDMGVRCLDRKTPIGILRRWLLSYNVNWERRLCMFPLFRSRRADVADTSYGDYPHCSSNPGKRVNFPDGCCFRIKTR